MTIFKVNQLSYQYNERAVLNNISFTINEGESIGIIGPNGSGKTTLLHLMSGLYSSKKEQILFKQRPITAYSKKELARSIAFMEQEAIPLLSFTVEEVVAMGRYPWLKPFSSLKRTDYQLIDQILIELDLEKKRTDPIYTLSGGERQLVAIARAMVQQPQVLFLDEPTTYLDIGHQVMVMNHIRQWQQRNKLTVIFVLHDLNLAAQYTDKLILMNQGKLQAWGNVTDVLEAQKLELVYQTKPVVIKHPVTGVSQILLHG